MMARKIAPTDTPQTLARAMLGDGRLHSELEIPGWSPGRPLPVGATAFIRGEKAGPPARWLADPKDWGKG